SERLVDSLKKEAVRENDFSGIQSEYDALRAKLLSSKRNDLQQHKDEIKQVLENEIVSRYYYEKGRYEANFKYDKELAQAVKTMQDKSQVTAILKGDGNYKVIGKPQWAMVSKKAEEKDSQDQ
ncbi:MAG: peptidase S41, partial [Bacteroidetes bacterium]|nr:peptidase S41 [Bacteroidota bacterium]